MTETTGQSLPGLEFETVGQLLQESETKTVDQLLQESETKSIGKSLKELGRGTETTGKSTALSKTENIGRSLKQSEMEVSCPAQHHIIEWSTDVVFILHRLLHRFPQIMQVQRKRIICKVNK